MTLVIRISDRSESAFSRSLYMEAFHTIIPWSLLICAIVFLLFRFYRIMWEFASVDELMQIVLGVTVACVLVTMMGYSLLGDNRRFPNSVYLSAWLLANGAYWRLAPCLPGDSQGPAEGAAGGSQGRKDPGYG